MSDGLSEVIKKLIVSLDDRKAFHSLDACTQDMLDRALDRVIEGTDQKIRLVPGYKRKLHKSILTSLEYVDSLIDQIPPPIELNSNHYASNTYLRNIFPTMAGLQKVFNQSWELREYFEEAEHQQSTESCVLLCMRKDEQTILGMQLEGDQVIKDVMQIRVSFAGHQIYAPAADELDARRELKCCIFEGLVGNALGQLSELREKRRQLETKQQILHSRLRRHLGSSVDKNNYITTAEETVSRRNDERQLEQVEQELIRIGYVTPEICLSVVNAILMQPEEFVSLKNTSMLLDSGGIKRPDKRRSPSISEIQFSEVQIKGAPPRVVTLAKIKREEVSVPRVNLN